MQHNERDKEIELVQSNHPYKHDEQEDKLFQTETKSEKSKQSIKRDVARKRQEIKNSTIGGF